MAKILNRAILVAGERKKVGTYTVNIIELDKSAMVSRAGGTTVPADSDAGFATGCYFYLTSGGVVGGTVYVNEGTSASADFNAISGGGGSGVGTLNQVYENGSSIVVDSGPVTLTDGQATANSFSATKTGTGSGDIFALKFENAGTGRGVYIDMDDGIAANALLIDSGGTARTGADIVFTDDSTGTHILIDANSSGSGKSTGFDWTDSYAGSNASIGVLLTMGNSNGLSSEGIQIVRGTGVRTGSAINIDEDSTGNVAVIDIDVTAAYTGDVLSIVTSAAATGNAIFVNLDSAVAATALHIEGSGTRTQPYVELSSDSIGSAHYMAFTIDGAGSGNFMNFATSTTFTGSVLKFDMEAAVGAKAIFIDSSNETRTDDLIEITADGAGITDVFEINDSSTRSGHVFDINVLGTPSGDVLNIVYSGAATGDAVSIDLTTGVAAGGIVLVGAGTRIQDIVQIDDSSAGSTHIFDINVDSTSSGNVFDVVVGAVAFTGDVYAANLGATATAASAIVLVGGAVARTVPLVKITDAGTNSGGITFDINLTGINAATVFDIDATAATTGSVFDYATNSASTGTVFEINMTNAISAKGMVWTTAGARDDNLFTFTASESGAVDLMEFNVAGTSSGHVLDVNVSTAHTGNVLDITYSGTAISGNAIDIEMATNLAGNAIFINRLTGNEQTAPLVYIENTGTDGGTNDHDLFIKQIGVLDSNMVQLTFATGASTGDALGIAMDTNVAGRAISITSAGTGVTDEGNAIDITHTGVLIAAADVVNITSSGAISSTSNVLAIDFSNGDAGSYGLYINATQNGEAIKVDAGEVVFDEGVTAGTYKDASGSLGATMLELNCVADVSARLVAAGATETAAVTTHDSRIILLDTAAGSVVTLPAATGSGAVYKVIVSVLATSNSHIVKVTGDDVMYGMIWFADADTAGTTTAFVTAADSDTVTLNRTTTGSVTIGEWMEFVDVAADKWAVRGWLTNSGSGGTPFSATV
jgi:hypothetical protein